MSGKCGLVTLHLQPRACDTADKRAPLSRSEQRQGGALTPRTDGNTHALPITMVKLAGPRRLM